MSDLLAIVQDTAGDDALLCEIARLRPGRVTVLVENLAADEDELARLIFEIERRTDAIVVGMVGDSRELEGWRFDRVVSSPRRDRDRVEPLAA